MQGEFLQECQEYGYWQIDGFAAKQKKRKTGLLPGPKRWVPLPKGLKVHTFPSSSGNAVAQPRNFGAKPLRSCLSKARWTCKGGVDEDSPRSTQSGNSESTAASSTDSRRVHFCDGLAPGSPAAWCETAAFKSSGRLLAEWIYIDRDICGFSVHEYAPGDSYYWQFASSDHARQFLEELALVEYQNQFEQCTRMACKESRERYQQEEEDLDWSLAYAGVKASYLSSPHKKSR